MAEHDRVEAYANALFEIARAEESQAEVSDELYTFARAFESNDELRTTLTDNALPIQRRLGIVADLFGPAASPVAASVVSFIVGIGRARDLPAIIDRLVARTASEKDKAVADVRSAIALTDEQRSRLAEALGKATGKQVEVKVTVDPTVLGGILAQIGDQVIDGTVRSRLDQLRAGIQ